MSDVHVTNRGAVFGRLMVALLAMTLLGAGVARAEQQPGPSWAAGKILVQPRAGVPTEEFARICEQLGGHGIDYLNRINLHVISVPAGAEEAMARAFAKNPRVAFAEKDMLIPLNATPNDPKYSSAWHLDKLGAPDAWNSAQGNNVIVAILDTGVDASHEDLAGKLVQGRNVASDNNDTSDINGHGTSVAGTVAAVTNNNLGVASVAPQAKIMPIRITDSSNGYAATSKMAAGLTWAADHGARVANISYAATGSNTVANAASYFRSKGGVVLVAAGNEGEDPGYSDSPHMISVAATTSSDGQPNWTNYGAFVDISAPGSAIPSTKNGGGYANYSGTSYATPVAAGVAALVISADATLTPDEIEQVIEDSAVDLGTNGWDEHYGHGRVNATAAVLAVTGGSPPGDSLPPTVSFLSPANGAVVSGTVSVDISASDNVGVNGVKLYANGSLVATDLNSPYQFGWDSSAFAQGASVTLAAKAWDAAGNEVSKSRSVTIADTTPPVVSAPSNKVVEATGALSSVSLGSATATDNVGGSLSAVPSTTGPFAVGVHTIVWTATDSAGNSASDSQTITVRDTTAPVVTAPAAVVVQASGTTTAVSLGNASATDLVDGTLNPTANNTGPFPVGIHTVTWRATDAHSNTGKATQTVTVVQGGDATAPVVTAPGAVIVEATGPLTPVSLGSATAVDDTSGSLVATPDNSGPFAVGTHSVIWTAMDAAGNIGVATQQVAVTDTTSPTLTAPPAVNVTATGFLNEINLGSATATDLVADNLKPVADQSGPFESGLHIITWAVSDDAGNIASATQIVRITPMVDFAVDQVVSEGGKVTVGVYLSGEAPAYPVVIPYVVSGTAEAGNDHNATDGAVAIVSGTSGTLSFDVVPDGSNGEGTETVVFSIEEPVNAAPGQRTRHTVSIEEENLAPRVRLAAWQNDELTSEVYATEGLVTVQVSVNDPNSGDTHVYDWSLSDNSLAPDAAFSNDTFEIDPATLQPGTYIVRLSVSDDGSPAATTTVEMTFNVRSEPPTLGNTSDQDNDGIDDAAEGYSDSDGDGIANYLDAYDNTVLQGRWGRRTPVLLSTSAGLTLRLGSTAMAALNNEAMVSLADIDRFAAARGAAPASLDDGTSLEYPGGIVDFEVAGLGEHGQSVTVVIPQEVGLRPGAVYRKYTLDGGWRDFVIDAANSVASAPGSVVSCPAAGDPSYRAGLHAGDYCVQLVIQDGGPNDADGLANGVVQDPSGAGVSPAGAGEPTLAVDTGGGGGCSLAAVPTTATDPSLPLLTGLAFVLAVRRRARQR